MDAHERTVRGAAVTWYVHPDGSSRAALLGEKIHVAASDVERFDATEKAVPEPTPPMARAAMPEPPRNGRGASRDMWAAYADNLGVVYADDAKQSDIIRAVDGWREVNGA